jgi:hypothetical protein
MILDIQHLGFVFGPGTFGARTRDGRVAHSRKRGVEAKVLVLKLQVQKIVLGIQRLGDLDCPSTASLCRLALLEFAVLAILD